jgi:predicted DNA-binding transcriptional regulator YafY
MNKNPIVKSQENKPERNVSTRAGIERIFRIVSMLQNANHSGNKITSKKLEGEFGVDRATIHRDITFIRDRLRMDMEWDAQQGTYVIEENSQYLPPMELTDKDYLLLSFLQQCLLPYESTELGQEMLGSFQRLFGIFTGSKDWNQWAKTVHFRFADKPASTTRELKVFNILHRAIKSRKVVEFDYKSPRNATSQHKTIEPHLMVMHSGRWYFYGTDTETRHLKTFAFVRVSKLKETAKKFEQDPDNHPRDLLKLSFGIALSYEAPEDIVLEFDSDVVERLKESIWHPNQKLEDLPGGRARLTLRLNSTLEIQPWILGWGPKVKVLAPPALVESVTSSIQKMAAQYAA